MANTSSEEWLGSFHDLTADSFVASFDNLGASSALLQGSEAPLPEEAQRLEDSAPFGLINMEAGHDEAVPPQDAVSESEAPLLDEAQLMEDIIEARLGEVASPQSQTSEAMAIEAAQVTAATTPLAHTPARPSVTDPMLDPLRPDCSGPHAQPPPTVPTL